MNDMEYARRDFRKTPEEIQAERKQLVIDIAYISEPLLEKMRKLEEMITKRYEEADLGLQMKLNDLTVEVQNLVGAMRELRNDIAELSARIPAGDPALKALEKSVLDKLDSYLDKWK